MSTSFLKEECYQPNGSYCACIAFHLDEHHRRFFNASQLLEFSLNPNIAGDTDKNEPPQKLSIAFSTADVVVLGSRITAAIINSLPPVSYPNAILISTAQKFAFLSSKSKSLAKDECRRQAARASF